jgi:hypothetical protein
MKKRKSDLVIDFNTICCGVSSHASLMYRLLAEDYQDENQRDEMRAQLVELSTSLDKAKKKFIKEIEALQKVTK